MENYLGYPIIACYNDWIIVDDMKYNLLVFKLFRDKSIFIRYCRGYMPCNRPAWPYNKGKMRYYGGYRKEVEYYDRNRFDEAIDNMLKNAIYGGFRV